MDKKCKEHVAIHIRGVEPNTKKPVLVRFYGRIPPGGEVVCTDCKEPLVVRSAAQWAAVTGLADSWRARVPPDTPSLPLRELFEAIHNECADELARVAKGDTNVE